MIGYLNILSYWGNLLKQAMTARDFQNQLLIEQGRFEMALEIKRVMGIEKAIAISGFSKEELESEKLNGR